MIDQLITQIANTMNVYETHVATAIDTLINTSQPYEPIQGICKSTKCSEYDAVIRKKMRRFYRKKVGNKECNGAK